MLSIKTNISQAEQIKKYLVEKTLFNNEYKLIKKNSLIFIPVKKITDADKKLILAKFQNIEFVNNDFEKTIEKQKYQDYLKSNISKQDFSLLPTSYDIVGHIIIIDINPSLITYENQIAAALLKTNKGIKTLLKKSGIHEGEFRTQKLEYLAGENTKETIYKENNARIKLNVENVYFSPRLSTERKRIYQQIKPNENILVMFSGSGVYPIVISKNTKAKTIVGIEKNPIAHKYAVENLKLNKIKNIELRLGDVLEEVPKLTKKFERILMPLPKGAENFLDIAFQAAKKGTIIHFYDFEREDEIKKAEEKVKEACIRNKLKFKILNTVKCGQYSPGKFRICIDFEIV